MKLLFATRYKRHSFKKMYFYISTFFLLFTTGCHNSTHLRTQKILDENESIFSLSASMPIGGPESYFYAQNTTDYGSSRDHDNNDQAFYLSSGIAGLRIETSYLKRTNFGELGIFGGAGPTKEEFAFIFGGDFINYDHKQKYKRGLKIEINKSPYVSTIHSVQSIKSVITKKKPIYWGIHTLLSNGLIRTDAGSASSFNFRSFGYGLTCGIERIVSKSFSIQVQLDVSNVFNTLTPNEGFLVYEDNKPMISGGLGFNFLNSKAPVHNLFEPYKKLIFRQAKIYQEEVINLKNKNLLSNKNLEPDEKEKPVLIKYNPETGEEIHQPNPIRYNPETGERIN